MEYQLFKFVTKQLLVQSRDYYARSGDTQEESVVVLELVDSFPSLVEAESSLSDPWLSGNYTILPVYKVSK